MEYQYTTFPVKKQIGQAGTAANIVWQQSPLSGQTGQLAVGLYSPLYFRRVAMPPRMCRSALLVFITCLTCKYRAWL